MSNIIKIRFTVTNVTKLINNVTCYSTKSTTTDANSTKPMNNEKSPSPRIIEFKKKLREKTPLGKLEEHSKHPFQEQQPLIRWPNNTNPNTGEIGGPAGPEPTRYGDWERKGRVSDF